MGWGLSQVLEEALNLALLHAERTARCEEEGRWPVLSTREAIESVRRTLTGVADDKKAELLGVLSEAEAKCLVRAP